MIMISGLAFQLGGSSNTLASQYIPHIKVLQMGFKKAKVVVLHTAFVPSELHAFVGASLGTSVSASRQFA